MGKDLGVFYMALTSLFEEYDIETYMLSYMIDGEWHQMMKAPTENK